MFISSLPNTAALLWLKKKIGDRLVSTPTWYSASSVFQSEFGSFSWFSQSTQTYWNKRAAN